MPAAGPWRGWCHPLCVPRLPSLRCPSRRWLLPASSVKYCLRRGLRTVRNRFRGSRRRSRGLAVIQRDSVILRKNFNIYRNTPKFN
ncbi:hypothetical protein GQ55_6G249700 [Panicum hallii var. hallii]|uniref:Uncharacterized protein n=1 Tax=Panicum hallii var. hallii TaxID=1504633 RepID=A0A2T7D9I0_9POAL|nr:hypothetical protein GQ55_6G249700 [Panicum hallii var. hallii]